MEQIYRKVVNGARVRYVPYLEPEQPKTVIEFTEGQCLTAAGALGTMLLMVFERNIPPHKRVARKINAVQSAILDLFKGTGEPIHDDIAELMAKTWDRVMKELSNE
jgi:hypothetical protein